MVRLVKLSIQKPINNTFKNYKPGNLNVSTFFPFNSKYSTSFRDWVLFPQRSHPSNTIIHPLAQTDIFSLFPTNFPRQMAPIPPIPRSLRYLISWLQPTCSPKFRKAGHKRDLSAPPPVLSKVDTLNLAKNLFPFGFKTL